MGSIHTYFGASGKQGAVQINYVATVANEARRAAKNAEQ